MHDNDRLSVSQWIDDDNNDDDDADDDDDDY